MRTAVVCPVVPTKHPAPPVTAAYPSEPSNSTLLIDKAPHPSRDGGVFIRAIEFNATDHELAKIAQLVDLGRAIRFFIIDDIVFTPIALPRWELDLRFL